MSHDLRFHVSTIPNVSWPQMQERYQWMEEMGVDIAATADHFVDWTDPENPWFEGWTGLAAVAAVTSRMLLTISVTQIPLRNPAMLAHQAVTVDHISNGRLIVGLGTGLRIDPGTEMAGLDNWSNAERVDRFGEYVQILAAVMSQHSTTFEGEYYSVANAITSPGPIQTPRPPIMIAAMGPKMLRQAARYADVWNSLSFSPSFEVQMDETAGRVEALKSNCAEIGRDFAEIRCSFTLFDPEARKGGRYAYYDDIDDFKHRVRSATALGMSEIGMYYPALDESQAGAFEDVVRDVIPELKADFAQGRHR